MILDVAKKTFSDLNIPESPPQMLLWVSVVPSSIFDGSSIDGLARGNTRLASSDQCRIHKNAILLAESMRGKLEPEEWKPLLASSIIFYRKLRRRLLVRLVALSWAPLVLLLVGFFFALFVAAILGAPSWVAFLFVPFLFLGGVLVEGIYGLSLKRSLLFADRQAANVTGRLQFMRVLKKLDSLSQPDIQKRNNRKKVTRLLFVDRPTLGERIRNLELDY